MVYGCLECIAVSFLATLLVFFGFHPEFFFLCDLFLFCFFKGGGGGVHVWTIV